MRRLILNYLKENLRKAGVRAKMFYRTELGWFDVFTRRFTCDICFHPNLKRYEKTNSIVVTDSNEVVGKSVFTTPENLHKVLSKFTSKDFVSFEEWTSDHCDSDRVFYEKVFSVLEGRYGRTIAKKIVEGLLFLYTAGHAFEGDRVPYSALFPYMLDLGLIVKETKEIVKPKNFTASPTLDGVRIAKVELFDRLEEDRIYRIVKELGFEKAFIAVLGLSDRRGMVLKEVDVECGSNFYDVISKLDVESIMKVKGDPFQVLCTTLCYTALYEDLERLFKNLMDLGLAFKYPVHDVYGTFLERVYRTPKEVASVISSMSFCEIDRSFVERFGELLDMFHRRFREGVEYRKAFELGVIERCEGGIRVTERFENFVRVRFAKLISEVCDSLGIAKL